MKNEMKTREQLIEELKELRRRAPEIKRSPPPADERKEEDAIAFFRKNRHLFDRANEGVFILQDERFVFVNQRMADILGVAAAKLEGVSFRDYVWPEDRAFVVETYWKRVKGENAPDLYEFRVVGADGGSTWIFLSATATLKWKGKPATLYLLTNVTDRKQAEEALRFNEEKFRALAESTSTAIFLVQDSGIKYVNPAFQMITGYSMEDLAGIDVWDIIHPDHREKVKMRGLRRLRGDSPPSRYEIKFIAKNGQEKWVNYSAAVCKLGNQPTIVASAFDITEQKQALESLHESRQQWSNIIEFLPDATLVIDKEGKIIAWNRAMETLTGRQKESMLGKGNCEYSLAFHGDRRPALIDLVLHPEIKGKIEKNYVTLQRTGDTFWGETFTSHLPKGDTYLSATASVLRDSKGDVLGAIECVRDNTYLQRLKVRLNRAEKMEALGTLAGGVAHDLNNVLGVMVGYSELLAERLPASSQTRRYADNILQSSVKGAAIIQDLLTLARRGAAISEVVDMNRVVSDYLETPEFEKLMSYHRGVVVRSELADGLLKIKGSPVHLSKTVMNLVSNAAEAISDTGVVTIRTVNRYLDRPIRGYDDIQEGDYVVLTVSDSGIGISAQDMGQIFEPFYTKKVMGRSGTGLGLTVVWGTVKDHDGYIDVQSEEGVETIFTLYFPVTREEPVKTEKTGSPQALMGRGESILVVDDVREQQTLATSVLARLGYQVKAVSSGEEAVDYLKRHQADLVILDMIMDPGIDGLETYRRILEIHPRQKAIIVSGFSETDRARKVKEMGAGAFVPKPYSLESIGSAVRKELAKP